MNRPVDMAASLELGLAWHNRFAALGEAFYTLRAPTPLPSPQWVGTSPAVADLLGLDRAWLSSPAALDAFTGNLPIAGTQPLASVYSGHQFGHWAGQLGDGRAIWLGEIDTPTGPQELQLKGAGLTPYSRMGDGRAVLRSSIREFLCSEAMHGLGIPTTRALALTASPTLAGVEQSTGTVSNLFGRSYTARQWNLTGDLGLNNAGTANRSVVLESLTVYNGQLFVGGDDDPGQFEGRILRYNAGPTGDLSSPSVITLSASIGPEGLTINTGGTGFGAFTGPNPTLVAVEGGAPFRRATLDVVGNAATNTSVNVPWEADDVAYIAASGRFAVLQRNSAGQREVALYDANFSPLGGNFTVQSSSLARPRAMATASNAFLSSLTGLNLVNGNDYLLIPNDRLTSGDPANTRRLTLWNATTGQFVASSTLQFPAALGDMQSMTIDEANNIVYFGDQNQRIWAVAVPTPSAVALLGLAGLVAGRRRR